MHILALMSVGVTKNPAEVHPVAFYKNIPK